MVCLWCHNPESIRMKPSLMFYGEKCLAGCNSCIDVCPEHCHFVVSGEHHFDPSECTHCFRCVSPCYAQALTKVGETVTADYVMTSILSNKEYFNQSGGGVTFSGGECMLQIDFLLELLTECKKNGIHTAVDTAGNVPFSHFERIMKYTDLFLYDLKTFSEDRHKTLTGVSNDQIKRNFELLAAFGCDIIIRIPLVRTLNDDEMPRLAKYLNDYPHITVEILPYHSMGSSKYAALGSAEKVWTRETERLYTPSNAEVEKIKDLFLGAKS